MVVCVFEHVFSGDLYLMTVPPPASLQRPLDGEYVSDDVAGVGGVAGEQQEVGLRHCLAHEVGRGVHRLDTAAAAV